jgi:biotin carboxyl carrier protein
MDKDVKKIIEYCININGVSVSINTKKFSFNLNSESNLIKSDLVGIFRCEFLSLKSFSSEIIIKKNQKIYSIDYLGKTVNYYSTFDGIITNIYIKHGNIIQFDDIVMIIKKQS